MGWLRAKAKALPCCVARAFEIFNLIKSLVKVPYKLYKDKVIQQVVMH